MKTRTKWQAAVAGILCISAIGTAVAQESPWLVRARAVRLNWANKSDAGFNSLTPALLPADAVQVNKNFIPELDITYFFTKNIAAELILTYPQSQTVKIANGPLAETVGELRQLPPTLTLQYHFMPDAKIRPYVGAGLNYTKFTKVGLFSNIANAQLTLNGNSTGAAYQFGFDIPLNSNLVFNVDVKKIYIDSALMVRGVKSSNLQLDPVVIGAGLGWRF